MTQLHQQHTLLLATDLKNSILVELDARGLNSMAYLPYGQQSARHAVMTRLGFNGELREDKLERYVLGNGYRVYNPWLMCFHSPDSFSPFGAGELNSYCYCSNEPVGSKDPSGHIRLKAIPTRSLSPQRPRTPPKPQRTSVIVENQNYSTSKSAQPVTKNSSVVPIAGNPIIEPIATLEPSSVPRITAPQANINTPHVQASGSKKMPNLKLMIDPYHQPLPRGKKKMPMLPIGATETEIKKMPWLTPAVNLIRIS